jgi:secondary thiamine-phosphate synthase enzyme
MTAQPSFVWLQRSLRLPPYPRGFHLVTSQVVDALPEMAGIRLGLLHVFIQHTSASITLNENADPDVRVDMEMALNRIAPEDLPYVHTLEGPDDMPAHVKSSLLGASISIPLSRGKLNLGTWQGIYLCEHRDQASGRQLVLTAFGQPQ